MPKIKTHKATAKRVKKTAKGKLMHRRSYSNHFLTKKRASRKRGYAGRHQITGKSKRNLESRLGE